MNDQRETARVDQYIAELSEKNQKIVITLRDLILGASPELFEEFKWSMPNYSYNGLVSYLQVAKTHVNLGFHRGNELEDPENLLQGNAKTMRHIQIKETDEIPKEAITKLIQQAVALNK